MRPRPLFILAVLLMAPAAAPPLPAQTVAAPQGRCAETGGRPVALSGRRGPTLNRDVRVNDDLARFSRAF